MHTALARLASLSLAAVATSATVDAQSFVYDFQLDASQVVEVFPGAPVSTSGALGSCTVTLDTATGRCTIDGAYRCLESSPYYSALFGPAAEGEFGETITTFSPSSGSFGTTTTLDLDEVQAMLAGETYIEIQTLKFKDGEIRGQVVSTPSATAFSRTGSGLNPLILTVSGQKPALGANAWEVKVDCSGYASGFVALSYHVDGLEGVFTPWGELLVDMSSKALLREYRLHTGAIESFYYDIPLSASLSGLDVHAQAAVSGGPKPQLTNALFIRFGI